MTDDLCAVEGDEPVYLVRGSLEIPVRDSLEPFAYTIWVSLSAHNFQRTLDLWKTEGRESEPSYFGWLTNLIPGYPETLNLKTRVCTRPVGLRPFIELEPTDHLLAVEQREGITMARAQEIVEWMLHPPPAAQS